MRERRNWMVCMILMAAMLAGCSASPPEPSNGGNTAVPTESPIQSMEPEPSVTPSHGSSSCYLWLYVKPLCYLDAGTRKKVMAVRNIFM